MTVIFFSATFIFCFEKLFSNTTKHDNIFWQLFYMARIKVVPEVFDTPLELSCRQLKLISN